MADQEQAPAGKVVSIPGFGDVLIPDDMSPTAKQRFESEARSLYKKVPDDQKPATGRPVSWLDTAVEWLPKAGPLVGGMVGSMYGKVGAAIGGAAGEGYQQLLEHGSELPGAVVDVARGLVSHPVETVKGFAQGAAQGAGSALKEGVEQAALQGVGELAGKVVAKGVGAVTQKAAVPLMRSALGHTDAVLSRAPDVAKIAMERGGKIPVSRSGIHKLDDILATKLGIADRKALEVTREAVADAWKKMSTEQTHTLFGALTAKNPAFRSAMANGLYHSAAYFARLTPQAIRAALGLADAVSSGSEQN